MALSDAVAGSKISFDSLSGNKTSISFDGTTLTVPQYCRAETCATLATKQDVSLLGDQLSDQLTQFGKRLSELEIKTEVINAKVNPVCPAKDLGTSANPATSCKDILDQRTADSSADSNCTTYLPTSGVYTVSVPQLAWHSRRLQRTQLLTLLHSPRCFVFCS